MKLDNRGLRSTCPDGHALYWTETESGTDYRHAGLTGGICTDGDAWDQDAARSHHSHIGRLRRSPNNVLGGLGILRWGWTIRENNQVAPYVNVVCRRNHPFPSALPEPSESQNANAYLSELTSWLHMAEWRTKPVVECPEHRFERLGIRAALDRLSSAVPPVTPRPDVRVGGSGGSGGLRILAPDETPLAVAASMSH